MAATGAENAMDVVVEDDERGVPWKERVEGWKENVKNNESETNKRRKPEGVNETMVDSGEPLCSKIEIEGSKLYPYRFLIVLRLIIVGFFFHVRLTNPVENAYALWITAVICEIWLAAAWILDQLPMWFPVNRETYLNRLSIRYEKQEFSGVDFFVRTEDPVKEPPLTTANAVLSVLAVDYPADKVSCYVSDDGSAMITFECLSETAEFAKRWVPFCKEFNIEPRAPEAFFSQKIDYLREKVNPSFVKKRREMKREYEEFKVRINALVAKCQKMPDDGWIMQDGTPWPGNNPRNHPSMIQVFLGHTGAPDINGNELPLLVYTSREKRPGYLHHDKAGAMNALVRVSGVLTNSPYVLNLDCTHYINNSKVVREAMCFMLDPALDGTVSYVQFPLRYNAPIQGDHSVNQNTVFYDITMKGLDGIQGPFYLGTGCLFRRRALYGYGPTRVRKLHNSWRTRLALKLSRNRDRQDPDTSPALFRTRTESDSFDLYNLETLPFLSDGQGLEKSMGHSPIFIASTLMEEDGGIPESIESSSLIHEAIHVMTCAFEEKTNWGKELGWIYGSVTGHIVTGMKMHISGWKSVYCIPSRPAFKTNSAMNLADNLHQLLHWALGSMEILLSRHCPLWYKLGSGQLHWLQRITYINITVYPLTSIPVIVYCFLPPVCLLTGKFITPTLDDYGMAWVASLFITTVICMILELQWSKVSVEEWWRNQQYWVIGGVSSHFFAILQGLLKVLAGIEIASPSSNHSKAKKHHENSVEAEEVYAFKWTNLLILPTTLVIVNFLAVVAGISSTINSGKRSWGTLSVKLCFALWVLVHLYPFVRGLVGRQNRTPTIVIIWSILLASIFSLLWFRIDPFFVKEKVPPFQQCTFDCI